MYVTDLIVFVFVFVSVSASLSVIVLSFRYPRGVVVYLVPWHLQQRRAANLTQLDPVPLRVAALA
jgi:hypothetical protein